MKNWISATLIVIMGINLVGCSTSSEPIPSSSKAMIGMFSGAIAGGLIGSAVKQKGGGRTTDIALGAVAGAIVGYGLGLFVGDMEHNYNGISSNAGRRPPVVSKATAKPTTVAADWRHTSHPIMALFESKPAPAANKVVVAEKQAPAPVSAKPVTPAASAAPAKTDTDKKQTVASAKTSSVNDEIKHLWHKLPSPSMQWFFNDSKQEEIG